MIFLVIGANAAELLLVDGQLVGVAVTSKGIGQDSPVLMILSSYELVSPATQDESNQTSGFNC